MNLVSRFFLAFGSLWLLSSGIYSQCDSWKKRCGKVKMNEFTSNGQLNTAVLIPGESAEIQMVFFGGQDYRIILCGEEALGQLEFKIKTPKGEVLFSNAEFEMTQEWDFTMATSKRLVVEIISPGEASSEEGGQEACVTLLVGYRVSTKKGFN